MPGRRLLFFFDGTSNSAASARDVAPTNVLRLNQAFTYGFADVPQIVFYFAGVGTRGDKFSAATGRGFDQIVIEAFVNLASNYMAGDTIYLFGFSRGAAAARALSGMLSDPGLIDADHLVYFPELWRYFVGSSLGASQRNILLDKMGANTFTPQVEMLAAFDTVAGSSWDQLSLFTKVRFRHLHLGSCVKRGIQILSIDDDRNPSFEPLLWDRPTSPDQVLEQIWMPGVHADIGGCSNGTLIGDISLLTLIDRIKYHCPELEWDGGVIERVMDRVDRAQTIEITYERPGVTRKFLRRKQRQITLGPGQYLHSICGELFDQRFRIRGKPTKYTATNANKSLQTLNTSLDELFARACKRALHNV